MTCKIIIGFIVFVLWTSIVPGSAASQCQLTLCGAGSGGGGSLPTGTWSLVQGPGSCGGGSNCELNITNTTLTLTAAANASGGTTVYSTTGTCVVNSYYDVRGFTTAANNGGPWIASAVSAGVSCTLANPNGVAETHAGTQILCSGTMTINAALVAGDQYIVLATVQGDDPPGYQVQNVTAAGNSIGPLVHIPEHQLGGMLSGPNFTRDAMLVYPTASLGGSGTSLLFVITGNGGTGTNIYFASYHPSAAGANVALDNSSGIYQGYTTGTVWSSQTFTTTGSNDLTCVIAFDGAGGPFVGISSFASPFNTNAYIASSRAFSCAISTSAAAVTWASAVDSQISSFTLGWNPTAYQPMGVMNWSYTGGANPPTSGNTVTGPTLANGAFGWQNGHWNLSQIHSLAWDNRGSTCGAGLLNNSGRLDDGSSVSASNTTTLCIAQIGDGATQTDAIKYDFGVNSLVPNMHFMFRITDDLIATDTSSIDAGTFHSSGGDFGAINWYGVSSHRFAQLETPSGNGGSYNLSGGNCTAQCPITVDILFETGSGGNTVSGVSASQSGSTSTFTGSFTAANWPVGYAFELTGCSGGSGWNYVKGSGVGDLGVFYVATANAGTITATQLVNSSPTGTPTTCTMTGTHVLTLFDKTGTLIAQSAHPGDTNAPSSYLAQIPSSFYIGTVGTAPPLTNGKHIWWGPVTISLTLTMPPL